MKEFIIDKNVDIHPSQKNYPKYFMDDLRKSRKVRIVVGGTTYKSEIKGKAAMRELVSQMITAGKYRSVDDEPVDHHERLLKERIIDALGQCPKECDDHHIFALAHVGRCANVITNEHRMATCRDKIRNQVGHDTCPDIRVIRTEAAYRDS